MGAGAVAIPASAAALRFSKTSGISWSMSIFFCCGAGLCEARNSGATTWLLVDADGAGIDGDPALLAEARAETAELAWSADVEVPAGEWWTVEEFPGPGGLLLRVTTR